jgi:NADPH2:quinone reductase
LELRDWDSTSVLTRINAVSEVGSVARNQSESLPAIVGTRSFQSKMRGGRMASGSGGRHPIRESAELGWYILRNWFKPGRKRMVPYSIQWLMRLKPTWFRHDLLTLLDLLKQGKIKPLIAQRLPLEAARRAHEMLGEGGVLGKIVLLPNGSQLTEQLSLYQ